MGTAFCRISISRTIISKVTHMRMKAPPHPGFFVKCEIIDAHGLSITNGAKALGVSR